MDVLFRVDSSFSVGGGHLSRCLNLARAMTKANYKCVFLCKNDLGNLNHLILEAGFQLQECAAETSSAYDAFLTEKLIRNLEIKIVVLDCYALGEKWLECISSTSSLVVVLDDFPNKEYSADLVFLPSENQNMTPLNSFNYKEMQKFKGVRYAILDKRFAALRDQVGVRESKKNLNIFFSLGNDLGLTYLVCERLLNLGKNYFIDAVVGKQNKNLTKLRELSVRHRDFFDLHVETDKMPKLLQKADLGIGSAGSVSWERCCLKLPSIICQMAPNQVAIANYLASVGAALDLGRVSSDTDVLIANVVSKLNDSELKLMSEKSSSLVDGLGAERVSMAIINAWEKKYV